MRHGALPTGAQSRVDCSETCLSLGEAGTSSRTKKNAMSLFNWFARKKAPAEADVSSTGLAPSSRGDGAPISNRRGERMARREYLYVIVRECMNRAGVLSSTYKFKVLSLDGW